MKTHDPSMFCSRVAMVLGAVGAYDAGVPLPVLAKVAWLPFSWVTVTRPVVGFWDSTALYECVQPKASGPLVPAASELYVRTNASGKPRPGTMRSPYCSLKLPFTVSTGSA